MLSLKQGGHAHVMNTYRDIWIVPHGQKLLMRMLNVEYERVSGMTVPGSQAGWEKNRETLEQVFTVRGIQEIAATHSQVLSTCFMSIIK